MDRNLLVLVDENDKEIGTMEKLEAHQKGLLHRAFSIIVKNKSNEWLIHQRAEGKYHSEGLWTNTCCSHPTPAETLDEAVHRRLQEEMGFDCELNHQFHFIYKTELDNSLIENELDHVFLGYFDGQPSPNISEVSAYKWISYDDLTEAIQQQPENFTYWFKEIVEKYGARLK